MSYIVKTGNLTETPELHSKNGRAWTRARVATSDRYRDGEQWVDGPTEYRNIVIFGADARALVAAATRAGNIRVMFAGEETLRGYERKDGTPGTSREVVADMVAVTFGQDVAIAKADAQTERGRGARDFQAVPGQNSAWQEYKAQRDEERH